MNSLLVKILTAVLTFSIGVGTNALWVNTWAAKTVVCHFPATPRSTARLEIVVAADGGVHAIATPYDEQLDELARKLGATFTSASPIDLRRLAPYDQRVQIERRLAVRRDLRHQILVLSKQRDAFLEAR